MTKAYLNALYEEGTRAEIFEWLCKKDAEVDALRAERELNDAQKLHGERVAARRKDNPFG